MTTSLVKNGNDQVEFTNKKEDGENEWDSLYDDSGQSLTDQFKKLELANSNSNKKPLEENCQRNNASRIDYLKFEPKTVKPIKPENKLDDDDAQKSIDDEYSGEEYAHIIEIYDFPVTFKNENIINAFKESIGNDNFSLKWVDDTHCLGIFSNSTEASKALKLENAFVKARPVNKASEESKRMAKRKLEYLKPYKPRPQTSNLVASKLIGASLGIRNMLPKEKIDQEKNKIKLAKEKHRKEKDQKEAIWNGQT